jgi:hypothetical protein
MPRSESLDGLRHGDEPVGVVRQQQTFGDERRSRLAELVDITRLGAVALL